MIHPPSLPNHPITITAHITHTHTTTYHYYPIHIHTPPPDHHCYQNHIHTTTSHNYYSNNVQTPSPPPLLTLPNTRTIPPLLSHLQLNGHYLPITATILPYSHIHHPTATPPLPLFSNIHIPPPHHSCYTNHTTTPPLLPLPNTRTHHPTITTAVFIYTLHNHSATITRITYTITQSSLLLPHTHRHYPYTSTALATFIHSHPTNTTTKSQTITPHDYPNHIHTTQPSLHYYQCHLHIPPQSPSPLRSQPHTHAISAPT